MDTLTLSKSQKFTKVIFHYTKKQKHNNKKAHGAHIQLTCQDYGKRQENSEVLHFL